MQLSSQVKKTRLPNTRKYEGRASTRIPSLNRDLLFSIIVIYYFVGFDFAGGDPTAIVTNSSGNTIWQAFVVLALGNGFLLAAYFRTKPLWRGLWPFIPMICWITLSIIWSEYPLLTLRRGARLTLELILLATLVSTFDVPERMLKLLFRVFLAITLADVLSLALSPVVWGDLGFSGVHGQKNVAGGFLYLALPVFAIGITDRTISGSRIAAAIALVFAACVLILTQSKTAMAVSLLSIFLVAVVRMCLLRDVAIRIPATSVVILLICLSATVMFSVGPSELFNMVFSDPSFTGRDRVWDFVLRQFETNPTLGVGYGALWQVGPQIVELLHESGVYEIVNEGHNGYLDILAQLGWVGLAILALFIAQMIWILVKRILLSNERALSFASYSLYVGIGSIFYNLTESFYFRSGGAWLMIVLILLASTIKRTDESHKLRRAIRAVNLNRNGLAI
jgi:exopolysaccharide production protein ExoQ